MGKQSRIEEIVEFIETLKELHGNAKREYERIVFRNDILKYSREYYHLTGQRLKLKKYLKGGEENV